MTRWERTRSFFPVVANTVYLDHAGVGPISTRVEEALRGYLDVMSQQGAFDEPAFEAEAERVRGRAATLLGARTEEIAFAKNTTAGLGLVAAGLDWKRGDLVVSCDLEYPSNVYPWWGLASRGVETRLLAGESGRLPLERVEEALREPRVRLLALSSVEFASGAANDVEALGRLCRERGVLFCVDAIQSVGCLPLDVERASIDFLAADGHKWLCALEGCAIFYCASRVLAQLTPPLVGWHSVLPSPDYSGYEMKLRAGAARFEEGTLNTAGIYGLGAAIDLVLELGVDAIGRRVLALTDRLVEGLLERGATVHSPRGLAASGIVSFSLADETPDQTQARLRARRMHTVVRRGAVRASPHYYVSEAEIDAVLAAL